MEENWSMDKHMKDNVPLITRISNYMKFIKPVVLCIVALICIIISIKNWDSSFVAVSTFVIMALYLIINIFLMILSKLGKEIPFFFTRGTFILSLLFTASITYILWTERNDSWIWIISICVLFFVNLGLSQTYKEKWDMPDSLLKQITKLQWLGILIAFLQLVIAYPQLEQSFKSATSGDIDRLYKLIERKTDEFNNLKIPDIPDSLVTEDILKAREYQRNLSNYYVLLNHSLKTLIQDFTPTKEIIELRKQEDDSLKQMMKDMRLRDVIDLYKSRNETIQRKIENVRYFSDATTNIGKYMFEAINYYLTPGPDSSFCKFNISPFLKKMEVINNTQKNKILPQIKEISDCQENGLKDLERARNIKKALNIVYKTTTEFEKMFSSIVLSDDFRVVYEYEIDMCYDLIVMLNLLQNKQAYDLNY